MDSDRHVHRWMLVSAVLDGKGSWRTLACDVLGCEATAVQPATGDVTPRQRDPGPA